jgi:hypothetical protein
MEVAQDTRHSFVTVLMNPWVLLPHCLEVMSQYSDCWQAKIMTTF